MEMVIRHKRLKANSVSRIKQIARHRFGENCNDIVTFIISTLTNKGMKKLRKNATIDEFIISFPSYIRDEEKLQEVKKFLINRLNEYMQMYYKTKVSIDLTYVIHKETDNLHMHILAICKDKNKNRKLQIKPFVIKNSIVDTLKRYAPDSLEKFYSKSLGTYDLRIIRSLERLLSKEKTEKLIKSMREKNINKHKFKKLYMKYKNNPEELYKLFVEEKIEININLNPHKKNNLNIDFNL